MRDKYIIVERSPKPDHTLFSCLLVYFRLLFLFFLFVLNSSMNVRSWSWNRCQGLPSRCLLSSSRCANESPRWSEYVMECERLTIILMSSGFCTFFMTRHAILVTRSLERKEFVTSQKCVCVGGCCGWMWQKVQLKLAKLFHNSTVRLLICLFDR